MRFFTWLLFLCLLSPLLAQDIPQPRPETDLLHYRFLIALNDSSNRISAQATLTFAQQAGETRQLRLDLIGDSTAGMLVSRVVQGREPLPFTQTGRELLVELPPATQADTFTLDLIYEGVPSDGLIISQNRYGRRTFFGDNWPTRARHYLPVIDHPADKATVEFMILAHPRYQVVANGRLIEEADLTRDLRLTHWQCEAPLPTKVMVFGAAEFAVRHERAYEDIPLSTWAYPESRQEGYHDFAVSYPMLAFMDSLFGPYPFAKLASVQSTTRYGGMENASNIFYNENEVTGLRQNERTVAHEIVHQWFGNSASERDWPHLWLSEGFATYGAHLYFEHTYGDSALQAGLREDRNKIFDAVLMRPVIDTSQTDLMQLLNVNSYQKGSWVLHMLRHKVGEEAFFTGLRTYYNRYQFGNATTADFQQVMEEASGENLEPFFAQWLYRPDNAKVTGTWRYRKGKGEVRLDLAQRRSPAYDLPLEVGIRTEENGPWQIEVLRLDEASHRFDLPVEGEPVEVRLDPRVKVLVEMELEEK